MSKEVNSSNFENNVLKAEKPVLVDFWAEWCGPCRMLLPIISELATEMEAKIDIYKCNIDEDQELATKYNVKSIPTLIIFQEGKIVNVRTGAGSKTAIKEWIENNI
jgi:thioredoxin 1